MHVRSLAVCFFQFVPRGLGTSDRGFAPFLARSYCLKTAKLRYSSKLLFNNKSWFPLSVCPAHRSEGFLSKL